MRGLGSNNIINNIFATIIFKFYLKFGKGVNFDQYLEL